MATASEAIAEIAATAVILPSTVFRTARALREADTGLWAQGSTGQAAHVGPSHLVNLTLGLVVAVAEPVSSVPAWMPHYRELTFPGPYRLRQEHRGAAIRILFEDAPDGLPLVPGVLGGEGGFGGDLERLLDRLSQPGSDAAAVLEAAWFTVELILDPRFPRARIGILPPDLPGNPTPAAQWFHYTPQHNPAWNLLSPPPPAPFVPKVALRTPLFVTLAALWADTRQHHARTGMLAAARVARPPKRNLLINVPGGTTPERKTAAARPLQGTSATVLSDQPADTELDKHAQAHPIEERENSQPPPGPHADRSLQPDWSDPL